MVRVCSKLEDEQFQKKKRERGQIKLDVSVLFEKQVAFIDVLCQLSHARQWRDDLVNDVLLDECTRLSKKYQNKSIKKMLYNSHPQNQHRLIAMKRVLFHLKICDAFSKQIALFSHNLMIAKRKTRKKTDLWLYTLQRLNNPWQPL